MGLLHFPQTIASNQPYPPQLSLPPLPLLFFPPLFTSEKFKLLFKIKFLGKSYGILSHLQVTAY